ncbi:MAG: hypothetical protein WCF30_04895 [Terracidiphilus sp.]
MLYPKGKPMLSNIRNITLLFAVLAVASLCAQAHAQAALLMEEPYGFFGALNPTGHNAIYFERICAATPVKLRRCGPGELGAVIAPYQGIEGYDWVAIPLIPYLYSVGNAADVPTHVDHETVVELREHYREENLESLGANLSAGNLVRGGWTQLLGATYERRIYAFRFETTEAQDDALIEKLNASPNRTRFNLLFNNCADFARVMLNDYFPRTFRRSIFPDAGMTTPKQITYKLVRFARKNPGTELTVFEIPQIPGYRHRSHSAKTIDESFVTTLYAIPIALMNPYIAGGLFVDYLVRGRYHLIPKNPTVLGPDNLSALTARAPTQENSSIAGAQAPDVVADRSTVTPSAARAKSDLQGTSAANE